MPASKETRMQVVKILDEEIGRKAALKIFNRLIQETHGNQSYTNTIYSIHNELLTGRES
jgi:hypothetical protein